MLKTQTRHAIDPTMAKALDTDQLRDHFHVGGLFAEGEINLVYTHYDRLILGSAVPAGDPLILAYVWDYENLFGGLSTTCDFVDLVQKDFYARPVAPLQAH